MTPATRRLLERARRIDPAEPVPSPCICVCTMDPASGLCVGCLRTLDEIAGWSGMDDAHKRAVWQQLAQRAEAT